jgi:hypothetical protein
VDVGSLVVLLDDGNRIYRVCLAIWADVVVGSHGDYELGIGTTEGRTFVGRMVVGRILGGQRDVEPIFLFAFYETVRDCRLGLCALDLVAW